MRFPRGRVLAGQKLATADRAPMLSEPGDSDAEAGECQRARQIDRKRRRFRIEQRRVLTRGVEMQHQAGEHRKQAGPPSADDARDQDRRDQKKVERVTGKLRRRQAAENDDQRDEEQRHRIGGFGALQRGSQPGSPGVRRPAPPHREVSHELSPLDPRRWKPGPLPG